MHTLDDTLDNHVYHSALVLSDKAAELHYETLAITLHSRQFLSQKVSEYAAARGILLIRGVEQDIEGMHVLLINFPKDAADGISTFSDLARVKARLELDGAQETLINAAHAFFSKHSGTSREALEASEFIRCN